MSRIGKKPILIPQGVNVKIEGQTIKVSGPKGELFQEIRPEIKIEIKGNEIFVTLLTETPEGKPSVSYGAGKKNKALWGLSRALLANMIKGANEGYEKKLEIKGLGYKAQLSGENLLLYVGYSHPVEIKTRPGIKFSVDKNIITVSGIDKELVGETSAVIRRVKPPEPYKGKGIKYFGEKIRKKMGKKAATGAK